MLRTFNLFRAFFGVCTIAALVASGVLLFLGDVRGGAAAAVVAASAMTFTARTSFRSPRLTWLALALLGTGLVILGVSIAVVISGLAAAFVLQLAVNALLANRIGRITLERLDHSTVMRGAENLVQEFSADGFRVIGGYRFHIGGRPVVLTVMIGPGRDRVAVVTDKVWQVVSQFGSRTFVTGNSGVSPVPASILRQQIAGGAPAELVRAHDAAMTLLSGRSLRPDPFTTDDEALDAVRQLEERAVAFIGRGSLRTALRMETEPPAGGVLSEDPQYERRVNEWIRA